MANKDRIKQLNNYEAAAFSKQLALSLSAGLPQTEGLTLMLEDSKNDAEREILEGLISSTQIGLPLSEAMADAKVFPEYMVQMVRIGETTGNIDNVFEALGTHYEREYTLSESIKSSTTYPLIMIGMVFVITAVIVAKVLPIFAQVFNQLGADMGGVASTLLAAGMIISKYSVAIIAILIILAVLVFASSKTQEGKQKLIKLVSKTKYYRTISDYATTCKFASGMALTLSSGLSPEQCLELTRPLMISEDAIAKIDRCIEAAKNGEDIYKAMTANSLLTGLYAKLATIGHRTGRMEESMSEIARLSQNDLDKSIDGLLAILEPALVVIISIIVGAVLLSVMLPLIGIMSVI